MENLGKALERVMKNTLKYMDNVGKFVKLKTVDKGEHVGWLRCIDPYEGNFFLVQFDDNQTKVINNILILGEACSSLEVLEEPNESMKAFFERGDKEMLEIDMSPDQVQLIIERKHRLFAWIKKHRLQVEDRDQILVVCDNVTVKPPYTEFDCASPNPQTLKSIRMMVRKLPRNV